MPRKKNRSNVSSFPLHVQEFVEIDYRDKLSKSEKDWLDRFNESEYGSNPERILERPDRPGKKRKRKAYKEEYKRRNDAMSPVRPPEKKSTTVLNPAFSTANSDGKASESYLTSSPEDALIAAIDMSNGFCPVCESGNFPMCKCAHEIKKYLKSIE